MQAEAASLACVVLVLPWGQFLPYSEVFMGCHSLGRLPFCHQFLKDSSTFPQQFLCKQLLRFLWFCLSFPYYIQQQWSFSFLSGSLPGWGRTMVSSLFLFSIFHLCGFFWLIPSLPRSIPRWWFYDVVPHVNRNDMYHVNHNLLDKFWVPL